MTRTKISFLGGFGLGVALATAGFAYWPAAGPRASREAPTEPAQDALPAGPLPPAGPGLSPMQARRVGPAIAANDADPQLVSDIIEQLTQGQPGSRQVALARALIQRQRWPEALAAIEAALASHAPSALVDNAVRSLPAAQLLLFLASHSDAYSIHDQVAWLVH